MNSFRELVNTPGRSLPAVVMFVMTALLALFGPMDLLILPYTQGLDALVATKLAISGLMTLVAAWGFWHYAVVRRSLTTMPAIGIAIVLGLTLLGATSRISVTALPSSLINYSAMVFVLGALAVLGLRVFSLAIVAGVSITAIGGLLLFYLVPEFGIFAEPTDHGQFIYRLGGMAHPNSTARSATMGVLLTIFLYRTGELRLWLVIVLLAMFGWTGYLALSRTAIVAGIAGMAFLFVDKMVTRRGIIVLSTISVIGVIAMLTLFFSGTEDSVIGKALDSLSKSGDREELTTGTGRTDIWAAAAEHISVRPYTGWGLNSGPVLLSAFSSATHNAVMHASLSGGLLAGAAMIALLLWNLWNVLNSSHLGIRAISAFLLLSCLTEDTVLETFPGPCTLMWFICCLFPVMGLAPLPRRTDRVPTGRTTRVGARLA